MACTEPAKWHWLMTFPFGTLIKHKLWHPGEPWRESKLGIHFLFSLTVPSSLMLDQIFLNGCLWKPASLLLVKHYWISLLGEKWESQNNKEVLSPVREKNILGSNYSIFWNDPTRHCLPIKIKQYKGTGRRGELVEKVLFPLSCWSKEIIWMFLLLTYLLRGTKLTINSWP